MRNRAWLWALVAVLLVGFSLRVLRLGAQSLWYDETVSVFLAGRSIPELIAHTAGDIHPPGYYLLLHVWTRLAGHSEFAAAFASVWFGVLLVALAYRLGASVFGRGAGLLAALLVALSPYNLWYSQEVRMYTLAASLGMGVLWCVAQLVAAGPKRLPSWRLLAAYAILAAAGLWVLYYFAFLLIAVNLLIGAWWLSRSRSQSAGWRWLVRWLVAQGVVVILYSPWLPVAWRQATSPPVPPWRTMTPLGKVIVDSWSALSLGQTAEPAKVWPVLVLTAILFILGVVWARPRGGRPRSLIMAGYVLVPVLLIWLASYLSPLFHVRYVFTYSTPFYVVVGAGLASLWRRWRPAVWLALVVLIAFSAASIWAYHTDYRYAADDHRAATQFVADHWRPGDAILVDAGYVYTALLTYWEGDPIAWRGRLVGERGLDYDGLSRKAPVVLLAGTVDGDPSLGWGDPASDFYAMDFQEATTALGQVFSQFDRVWLYRCYDTVTDPEGDIRHWLDEHGQQFEDQVFTGEAQLRVQGYMTSRDPLQGAAQVDDRLTDGSLELVALATPQSPVPVGGAADLDLAWRVGEMPVDGRILFAGLVDDAGRRWAQTDVRPAGSVYRVESWQSGVTVRTPLRVPVAPGTPPGRYRLEVGWYRFVDGQPVWLPWTSGNLLFAGDVVVAPPDDWWTLPVPAVQESIGVTVGKGLRLVGANGSDWQAKPGESLQVEVVWQALGPQAEPAETVLLITDDAGSVLAESATGLPGPGATLDGLESGQAVRVIESFGVPETMPSGTCNLVLGRRRDDGSWLPVRRGVFSLGATIPIGTVHVVEPMPGPALGTPRYPDGVAVLVQ
jgi:mannosyltransferase